MILHWRFHARTSNEWESRTLSKIESFFMFLLLKNRLDYHKVSIERRQCLTECCSSLRNRQKQNWREMLLLLFNWIHSVLDSKKRNVLQSIELKQLSEVDGVRSCLFVFTSLQWSVLDQLQLPLDPVRTSLLQSEEVITTRTNTFNEMRYSSDLP